MKLPPKTLWFLAVLPTLFGFDFWTKEAARSMPVGSQVPVLSDGLVSLSWMHAENPDIAFSIPVPMPVILLFGVIAIGVLVQTMWVMRPDARLQAIGAATLCAGALGNLVDRVTDGSVTDFARVYSTHPDLQPWLVETFGTATWPIFNVADVAILGGVLIYGVAVGMEPPDEPDD